MNRKPRVLSELLRIADYAGELKACRNCGDDERIDRAFRAVCLEIWGYTVEDFDDESLNARDHAYLDRMTWKRACAFAMAHGYDLFDYSVGHIVTDWWGFTWMILAEKRGLLTPQARAAAWQRYEASLASNVVAFRAQAGR